VCVKGVGVGQGRLFSEFHVLHIWHSCSYKHPPRPPSQLSEPMDKGDPGGNGDSQGPDGPSGVPRGSQEQPPLHHRLQTVPKHVSSETRVDRQPPRAGVNGPFLGGCQQKYGCDSLVPTPGGGSSIGVCLDRSLPGQP